MSDDPLCARIIIPVKWKIDLYDRQALINIFGTILVLDLPENFEVKEKLTGTLVFEIRE